MGEWIEVSEGGDAWDQKQPIQGFYQSTRSNVGPNGSNMHMLKTKDGVKGVWGSAVLDNKFEQVPQNAEVKIEYLGKEKSKTGVEYKNYKFQYRQTEASKVADTFEDAEVL